MLAVALVSLAFGAWLAWKYRPRAAPEHPAVAELRIHIAGLGPFFEQQARARVLVARLTGKARDRADEKIANADAALRGLETTLRSWRAGLEARGLDVSGIRMPAVDVKAAEEKLLLEEASAAVERELTE
ncbi:MAG: hypothetical protein ACRENE_14865 [Polyangiaceae bacterium]